MTASLPIAASIALRLGRNAGLLRVPPLPILNPSSHNSSILPRTTEDAPRTECEDNQRNQENYVILPEDSRKATYNYSRRFQKSSTG